jgi:ribosomal protein S18 acetylase RimI-like enzyme
LDWSTLVGVAEIRPYRPSDADSLKSFVCVTPGENFTREVQRLIRDLPNQIDNTTDDVWIGVAHDVNAGVVGVVVYQAATFGEPTNSEQRQFIVALGVRPEFRRRGVGTLLKTAAILDMSERGISGPTVSLVNRRNNAMMRLNTSRFSASAEPDPENPDDFIVTVVVEPLDA